MHHQTTQEVIPAVQFLHLMHSIQCTHPNDLNILYRGCQYNKKAISVSYLVFCNILEYLFTRTIIIILELFVSYFVTSYNFVIYFII